MAFNLREEGDKLKGFVEAHASTLGVIAAIITIALAVKYEVSKASSNAANVGSGTGTPASTTTTSAGGSTSTSTTSGSDSTAPQTFSFAITPGTLMNSLTSALTTLRGQGGSSNGSSSFGINFSNGVSGILAGLGFGGSHSGTSSSTSQSQLALQGSSGATGFAATVQNATSDEATQILNFLEQENASLFGGVTGENWMQNEATQASAIIQTINNTTNNANLGHNLTSVTTAIQPVTSGG